MGFFIPGSGVGDVTGSYFDVFTSAREAANAARVHSRRWDETWVAEAEQRRVSPVQAESDIAVGGGRIHFDMSRDFVLGAAGNAYTVRFRRRRATAVAAVAATLPIHISSAEGAALALTLTVPDYFVGTAGNGLRVNISVPSGQNPAGTGGSLQVTAPLLQNSVTLFGTTAAHLKTAWEDAATWDGLETALSATISGGTAVLAGAGSAAVASQSALVVSGGVDGLPVEPADMLLDQANTAVILLLAPTDDAVAIRALFDAHSTNYSDSGTVNDSDLLSASYFVGIGIGETTSALELFSGGQDAEPLAVLENASAKRVVIRCDTTEDTLGEVAALLAEHAVVNYRGTAIPANAVEAPGWERNLGAVTIGEAGTPGMGGGITDLSSFTTDHLTEGSTNLYYTDARTDARIAAAGSGVALSDEAPQDAGTADAGDGTAAARDDHVHGAELSSGAVGTAQIADNAVTRAKLAHGTAGRTLGFGTSGEPAELTPVELAVTEAPSAPGALAVGTGTRAARSDHRHPAQTVPALSDDVPAASGTAAAGTSDKASRSDHAHAAASGAGVTLSDETPQAPGLTGAAGDGGSASRDDHIHPRPPLSIATPHALGTAAPGVDSLASRADHIHPSVPDATTAAAGLMSADDKTKLDGVETGATADQTGTEIVAAVNSELGNQTWQQGGGGGEATPLSNAVPQAPGTAAAGTATAASRGDHRHAAQSVPALSDEVPQPLGTAAAGDGTASSRDDHIHAAPALRVVDVTGIALPAADAAQRGKLFLDAVHQTVFFLSEEHTAGTAASATFADYTASAYLGAHSSDVAARALVTEVQGDINKFYWNTHQHTFRSWQRIAVATGHAYYWQAVTNAATFLAARESFNHSAANVDVYWLGYADTEAELLQHVPASTNTGDRFYGIRRSDNTLRKFNGSTYTAPGEPSTIYGYRALAVPGLSGATQAEITAAIEALIDGAPTGLNTLNELAAAINDDPNYHTTVTTAIGAKPDLSDTAPEALGTAAAAGSAAAASRRDHVHTEMTAARLQAVLDAHFANTTWRAAAPTQTLAVFGTRVDLGMAAYPTAGEWVEITFSQAVVKDSVLIVSQHSDEGQFDEDIYGAAFTDIGVWPTFSSAPASTTVTGVHRFELNNNVRMFLARGADSTKLWVRCNIGASSLTISCDLYPLETGTTVAATRDVTALTAATAIAEETIVELPFTGDLDTDADYEFDIRATDSGARNYLPLVTGKALLALPLLTATPTDYADALDVKFGRPGAMSSASSFSHSTLYVWRGTGRLYVLIAEIQNAAGTSTDVPTTIALNQLKLAVTGVTVNNTVALVGDGRNLRGVPRVMRLKHAGFLETDPPWAVRNMRVLYPNDRTMDRAITNPLSLPYNPTTKLDRERITSRASPEAFRKFIIGGIYYSDAGTNYINGFTLRGANTAHGNVDFHAGEFKYPSYYNFNNSDELIAYEAGESWRTGVTELIPNTVFELAAGVWKILGRVQSRFPAQRETKGALRIAMVQAGRDDAIIKEGTYGQNIVPGQAETETDVYSFAGGEVDTGIINLENASEFYFLVQPEEEGVDYETEGADQFELGGSLEIWRYD